MIFRSNEPYESSRIHAAAVYCSDGRLGNHFDDFIQQCLGLPRYDRVALPGGPASLLTYPQVRLERQGILEELAFLAEAHGLTRIVLIAHSGCAFYRARLGLTEPGMEFVQRTDIGRAVALVHATTGVQQIEAYFARSEPDAVTFERIPV
ncbi:MAG: hypothetical protein K1X67_07640 [Fimbriimonadaceae bacterium]|nr:hypothetical protein [Fimbriimonadaceae bacterium]